MPVTEARPLAPTDDKRWRIVETTMRRHAYEPSALIETLHSVQAAFGCLDQAALRFVSRSLGVPPSRAYGVATFYHAFTLKPRGEHVCIVCTGTACFMKDSGALLDVFEEEARLEPGATTPDGKLSLLTARCLGSCSLAPALVVDGEVRGCSTPDDVRGLLQRWS